jgi:hypothetical protein
VGFPVNKTGNLIRAGFDGRAAAGVGAIH